MQVGGDSSDYSQEWSEKTNKLIQQWNAFYKEFKNELSDEKRIIRDTITTWLLKIYGQYPKNMKLSIIEGLHLFDMWYMDNHDKIAIHDLQSYACACMAISTKINDYKHVFGMKWWSRITRFNCNWIKLCDAELSILNWSNWNIQPKIPVQDYDSLEHLMYNCVYMIIWCTHLEWENLFDFEDNKRQFESIEYIRRNNILLNDVLPNPPWN